MHDIRTAPFSRRDVLRWSAGASLGMLASRSWFAAFGDEPPAALRDGKRLHVHSADPLNAEPLLAPLVAAWITPVERFFIRTHGNTPELNAASYRLAVEGLVERPLSLSLDELRAVAPASTVATITCAGNRRAEHSATRKISGVPWGPGAIGNARWDGVRLADVLKKAGLRDGAKHVWFESLDSIREIDGQPFGGSIPLEKALAEKGAGPILAHSMNEKPLPIDHGYPLRGIVPGYIGARSVKWLGKIVVSDRPSPNHYLQDVYKIVQTTELEEAHARPPIYEFPINGVIAEPAAGTSVRGNIATVTGYALPPGKPGVTIARVETSSDGRTWTTAKLGAPSREFCWRLWEAEVSLAGDAPTLLVRAIDSSGDAQPENVAWNAKGYLYNAWHRVAVKRDG